MNPSQRKLAPVRQGVAPLDVITKSVIFAFAMTGADVRRFRQQAGWTQGRLAARLGATQAYLSLMESGRRRVPDRVVRRVARLLKLPATALPITSLTPFDPATRDARVEEGLARLGYPGLAYRRKPGVARNPAELLLMALSLDDLDPRLAEALPWLLLRFEGFDLEDLLARAKALDLQNRLGFTVALAREVAERNHAYRHRRDELQRMEHALEPSRLAREDTYGRREPSDRMRAWLRESRSAAAKHWNVLTDLKPEHLPYAHQDPRALA